MNKTLRTNGEILPAGLLLPINGMSRSSGSEKLLPMKTTKHHLIAEVPRSSSKAEMTIGIDLGDVWSHYCTLNEDGEVVDSLLVECGNPILGPRGKDSTLRRWGLHLARRGGKQPRNRAIVAVARKLAVLLHRIWVTPFYAEAA
jgi:hypothetical protein